MDWGRVYKDPCGTFYWKQSDPWPFRFVAEELGRKVDSRNKNRTLVIAVKYLASGNIDIQNFPIKSKVDIFSKGSEQISGLNPKKIFPNIDAIYYLGAEIETKYIQKAFWPVFIYSYLCKGLWKLDSTKNSKKRPV